MRNQCAQVQWRNCTICLSNFHFHCRVEIKDVCLAREMQRVMAAEAEATRDARAKVKMLDFSTDVDKKCRWSTARVREKQRKLWLKPPCSWNRMRLAYLFDTCRLTLMILVVVRTPEMMMVADAVWFFLALVTLKSKTDKVGLMMHYNGLIEIL